ncbi:hypothetical protein U14_04674 [Candidatus Moduliflexus flocculans]|uniref:DUF2851 domain-containing protein n=1 Tax=Candidatus Moduliflexus flocculans TaxID=1499966 RepID=A0A0S6W577_9BACT|nr:hypothetical protein U14_04674 [Candidatus Moduliflexus flocculans]
MFALISEQFLSRIWEAAAFDATRLKTDDGRDVQIIRRGWKNLDAGPDFREAIIRLDGRIVEGDIELHVRPSDWHAHGHERDPNYADVALHVTFYAEPHDATRPIVTLRGAPVPTLTIEPFLFTSIDRLRAHFEQEDRRNAECEACCQAALQTMSSSDLLAWLSELGYERLRERAQRFGMWRKDASFQQILYQAICEGFGYSANKRPFLELARRLPLEVILRHLPESETPLSENRARWMQAALFGISGLLPPQADDSKFHDPDTREYLAALHDLWAMQKASLNARPMLPQEWRFFRLRPTNFPTRRLAALSHLLCQYAVQPPFDHYLSVFALAAHPQKTLLQTIALFERSLSIPAQGYWKGRYQFGKPTLATHDRDFLGQSRIRDIVISAIFPVFWHYAEEMALPDLRRQIAALYSNFPAPAQGNRASNRRAAHLLAGRALPAKPFRRADIYQGLLHLDRHHCSPHFCQQCPSFARNLI